MPLVQVINVLPRDHVDLRVPVAVQRAQLAELLQLNLAEIGKVPIINFKFQIIDATGHTAFRTPMRKMPVHAHVIPCW